jgi:serine protease Do
VRNTAIYECLSYDDDGAVRRTRRQAVLHGTAFAYRQNGGDTLLMTNEHVAEWPAVSSAQHPVDGVPPGCKRVSETIRLVDNEDDNYERDDVPVARVVADVQLDAAILRAHATLPLMPWKIGRSGALRERNVVEVRGFPLGAFAATNVGKVISARDHDDYKDWDHDDFVVDALLSPGNSGSPVLAVSCATGEFELVGVYHAGYTQGSALNVVVGIDQLRDLMTTLKRPVHSRSDDAVALDDAARGIVARAALTQVDPFFPVGALPATVRARSDGALVFELWSRGFPFKTRPLFVFEDKPKAGTFGEAGRLWFGGDEGLHLVEPSALEADAQAQIAQLVTAMRHDALAFFTWRAATSDGSREQFERDSRRQRSLQRVVDSRRDLVQAVVDLAERLAPHAGDATVGVTDILTPPVPGLAAAPNK